MHIRKMIVLKKIAFVMIMLLMSASIIKFHPVDAAQKDTISIRMKWFFAGTMGHFFYGKELGIFDKHNISLNINPGGPDNNSIKLVASGSDDIGVTSADEALIAIQKGIPIKIIGTLFFKSPVVFISKKGKGLDKFGNLKGKTVEIDYGSNAEVQFRAFAKAVGLKKGDYMEQPYTYNLIPFIEDKVDYSVAYEMDQVNILKSKGIEVNVFRPESKGISLIGDVFICRSDYFEKNKDKVDRFLKAMEESIVAASKNYEIATNALVQASQGLKPENETVIYKDTIKYLFYKQRSVKNDMELWEESYKFLIANGVLQPDKTKKWKTYIY